jgi:tetratricopeptide (TPR) repeat protein
VAKVFISYSHDSPAYGDLVLALAEKLRKHGIDAMLDQYVEGSPPQRWERWTVDQIEAAERVLVVCSETYYRRFRGLETPGVGRGADWEGVLIMQQVYNSGSRTLKFVPVFVTEAVEAWIPEPLRGLTYYVLTSDQGYDRLYDLLTGRAGETEPPLGPRRRKPRPPERSGQSASDVYNDGLRLLSDGKLDEALDTLSRAIALDPEYSYAYYNRGLAHYLKETGRLAPNPRKEIELAIEDFNAALALGYSEAMLFRNRANAFFRKGDIPQALADYTQAIALEPSNPLAYLNRAHVYEKTLQEQNAIADYKAVLDLPTDAESHDQARARLEALGVSARPRRPRRR